jgi:hypothetical protein
VLSASALIQATPSNPIDRAPLDPSKNQDCLQAFLVRFPCVRSPQYGLTCRLLFHDFNGEEDAARAAAACSVASEAEFKIESSTASLSYLICLV